jgi:hypothetical protein
MPCHSLNLSSNSRGRAIVQDNLSRVALLVLVAIVGWAEGRFLKRRDFACVTWTIPLVALTIWIAYPLTTPRVLAAAIVFVVALLSMRAYYRNGPADSPH